MTKLSFVLIVLCVMGSAWASPSQHPIPSAVPPSGLVQTPAKQQKQDAADNDRGTFQRPLIVETHAAPQSEAEAEKDATYQQQRAASEDVHRLGVTTLVVALFQTVALFATVLIMAYVAVRQLRAYVYPNIDGLREFSLTGPIRVEIKWENAGKTPARRFECHGLVLIADCPLNDKTKMGGAPQEPKDTGRHSKTTIYPGLGGASNWDSIPSQYPIPKRIVESILTGTHAIYIVGAARYRDVFGLPHRTQICAYIDQNSVRALIEAELKATPQKKIMVNFTHAHILNDFT